MSKIVKVNISSVNNITKQDIDNMYALMETFYDGMNYENFQKDLYAKNWCLILRKTSDDKIIGFTTIKYFKLTFDNEDIYGIFSGDTIVHKDFWHEQALFGAWLKFVITLAEKSPGRLYWFIICKGHRTYRILPVFYNEFYPVYNKTTPIFEKSLMDCFGESFYKNEYNSKTGIVNYIHAKDRLKDSVGEISENRLRDPHINFFAQVNPTYRVGDDLVCICPLIYENLNERGKKMFNNCDYSYEPESCF